MPLRPGTRLGHYDVGSLIGEGGMGQVWEATDTQLHRQVALKILPDAFVDDPDRLARFQREAQVLASLNHPNIGSIYGLEEAEGVRALVLELIEGPTLADRIKQGPIPVDEALPIAKQIAEALEAAHEQGVIHRDLKPANIKVRDDGTVKVLDFGLAKALDPTPEGDPSQSPTMTATMGGTREGVVLGTAAYMSPEQARGKPLDKRTDIWSFGCVLFEMLSGRGAFGAETLSDTIAGVIEREPDWQVLPTDTPPSLHALLRRCLAKEPKRRVHDIADARLAMEGGFDTGIVVSTVHPIAPALRVWRQPALVVVVGAVLLATLTGTAVWTAMSRDTTTPGIARLSIATDALPLDLGGSHPDITIFPDGTRVLYRGRDEQLMLRRIDQFVGAPLRGAESATFPFVSPDGQWVGFLDGVSATVMLKVSAAGGPSVTVLDNGETVWGASWGDDDQIVFGGLGLFRISADGGEVEALTTLDDAQGENRHAWPSIIPNRDAVVFTIGSGVTLTTGQVAVLDLTTREITKLGLAGVGARYVPTGHLVYAVSDGSIRAVPFDVSALEVTGSPVPLADGVSVLTTGAANFAVSDNGHLVFAPPEAAGTTRLVITDQAGTGRQLAEFDGLVWYPRFSPDGTRVAYGLAAAPGAAAAAELWVLEVESGRRLRLAPEGNNRYFAWAPDGTRLAHADNAESANRVLVTSADGDGEAETLLDGPVRIPTSWSPDGAALLLYRPVSVTDRDLVVLRLEGGDRAPQTFLDTSFQERGASFSPDGRWVAYVSDETGQDEIYRRPYPGPGSGEIVSSGGGFEVVWEPSGAGLFYRNASQLMYVAFDSS